MTNEIIKVGTFFSGIGSPEKSLERLKNEGHIKDYKVEFFSEIDKNAIKSYCAIHNVDESLNLGSITDIKGKNLPYCDLWIGGFPCQDISCAGKMRGFDFTSSTRSSLGWEMIRLLKEVNTKPKYVIFENVAMITSKKFKGTKYGMDRLKYFLQKEYFKNNDNKVYYLKCDIRKYFPSINHNILINNLKKISFSDDEFWFISKIINEQPDNLEKGLALGNQSSQWFALYYLDKIDRLIKEKLKVKCYVRYMDDFILIHRDKLV